MEDDYKRAKRNYQTHVLSYYDGNVAYHPYWYSIYSDYSTVEVEYVDKNGKSKTKLVPIVKRVKSKKGDKEYVKITVPAEFYPLGAPMRHQGVGEFSTYKLLQRVRNERPHLKSIPAIAMQDVLERVNSAFQGFWKKGKGYPAYPKERNYNSATYTGVGNILLYEDEGLLKVPGCPGLIQLVYHRPIQGTIKRANISKNILGEYFVSLMCEFEDSVEEPMVSPVIGIDMNIKAIDSDTRSFITMSTGEKVNIPRWNTQKGDKRKDLERKISNSPRDSVKRQKYIRNRKHLDEKIGNQKFNWMHTLTARISKEFPVVVIEDLELTEFHEKEQRGVRKAWNEAPFGEFRRQLQYKLGNRLVVVPPAYTSMRCGMCGAINRDLTLDDRVWTCPACGTAHDRDINAAINIRDAGIALLNNPIKTKEEKSSRRRAIKM